MYIGLNCNRKSQLSEILTEPLNPHMLSGLSFKGKTVIPSLYLFYISILRLYIYLYLEAECKTGNMEKGRD